MASAAHIDWEQETQKYDRPHPRLVELAKRLPGLPQRCLLDVGCSTARLRRLLPADFDYYGCDIADVARHLPAPGHFLQIDFNVSCDLSALARKGIDVINVSGVLEYLERPQELLQQLRGLVAPGSALVVSIINFQSRKFARISSHHPGWIYKPRLEELRQSLVEQGWRIKKEVPFLGKTGPRGWFFGALANWLGVDHAWVRRQARQLILIAEAH